LSISLVLPIFAATSSRTGPSLMAAVISSVSPDTAFAGQPSQLQKS
jgi:hypothetical protein